MRQGLKAPAPVALEGLPSPRPAFRHAWRACAAAIALAGLLFLLAGSLSAQEPQRPLRNPRALPGQDTVPPARPPRAVADTTFRDTTASDSTTLQQDSIPRDTVRVLMPTLGPPAGPLPSQRRIVFDKDAIRFSGALTLGELLRLIPGVQMVRLGWFGLPELVMIAGQGAASIEIDLDGFRQDNLGLDSAGFDVSRFPIGMYSRVEVEILPGEAPPPRED